MSVPALPDRPDVSVIIPCYNEEENAAAICAAVIVEPETILMMPRLTVVPTLRCVPPTSMTRMILGTSLVGGIIIF